jgi:hypothetical protein
MTFYKLQPEVAGGFGQNAVLLDPSARPPKLSKLHYEFDGWLGDPLLETVATFIVTRTLKQRLEGLSAAGAQFGDAEISKSGEFEDLHPGRALPEFVWLKVTGTAGHDDFGLSASHHLVVSQRVLDLLRTEGLSHCGIEVFKR